MSKGTLQLRDVKKGDRFWEKDGCQTALFEALESTRQVVATAGRAAGFELRALAVRGAACAVDENDETTLFEALESYGYGLVLWREEKKKPAAAVSNLLYGLKDWEELVPTVEEVVEKVLEDNCDFAGEGDSAIADRLTWPLEVVVFRRMDVGGKAEAQRIASDVLERTLEWLDEEFGNPDGDATDATDGMNEAAQAFGRVVVAEYVAWQCEPTGEVIKVTREEAVGNEKKCGMRNAECGVGRRR